MKAENAVKLSDQFVGVEVCNIADVVKAQAAGLVLLNKEGLDYKYETEDEESGEFRDPTEQEIFDRASKDIADGNEVYACMHIANDWFVQRNTNTNLQCDFYLHQSVYTMHENKMVKGEIIYLSLSHGHLETEAVKARFDDTAEKLYYFVGRLVTNGNISKISAYEKEEIVKKISSLNMDAYVVLKTEKDNYITRGIEEIFATKDALVDNLMYY